MKLFLIVLLSVFTFAVFGQDTATITAPTAEELKTFFASIGGLKGASALTIAVFVAQAFNLFIRSSIGGNLIKSGFYRMVAVAFLTWVISVLGLMITTEVSFVDALLNSANLAMFQTFVATLYKQYAKIDADKAKA